MSIDLLALVAIVMLSCTLVATLGAYLKTKKRLQSLNNEEDAMRARARHDAAKIIDQAQQAAFQIANEAVVTAEENKMAIREKLEEVATKQLREYQRMVHTASGDIEHEVTKMMGLKMDEELAKVQKEFAAYKKQKELDLDKRIDDIVKTVAKRVIGKSLDSATHTEMVIQALEDAKKEYGF